MIENILALAPGLMELLVIFFVFIVPVFLIVLFVMFMLRSNKKRRRLQMELDRLSAELKQVGQQAKGGQKGNSTTKSR